MFYIHVSTVALLILALSTPIFGVQNTQLDEQDPRYAKVVLMALKSVRRFSV